MTFHKLTLLILTLLLALSPVGHAVDRADYDMPYYILVDLENQIVTVYDSVTDGVVRQMLCSTGTRPSSAVCHRKAGGVFSLTPYSGL